MCVNKGILRCVGRVIFLFSYVGDLEIHDTSGYLLNSRTDKTTQ